MEIRTKESLLERMQSLNKENKDNKEQKKSAEMLFKNAQKVGNKIFCDLPLETIQIDRKMYQRPLQSHVRKIAKEWNDDKCDPLMVNYRNDGYFYVIDGQHRLEAARMRGIDSLVCVCFVGLSLKEEADIFTEQNEGTKKLTPYDTYKANLCRGEETDMTIYRVCEKYGIRVVKSTGCRVLRSVTMARTIVTRNDGERLSWIFNVFKESGWNNHKETYAADIMAGVNNVCNAHEKELGVVEEKLVEFFKTSNPKELVSLANIEYPNYGRQIRLNMILEDIINGNKKRPFGTKKATITRIA